MAAGLLGRAAGARVRVASAGVRAGLADPFAAAVLNEIGIDICDHEPKSLSEIEGQTFDLIIALSPDALQSSLALGHATGAKVEYWPTLDVSGLAASLSRADAAVRYRAVRDELSAKIKERFGAAA